MSTEKRKKSKRWRIYGRVVGSTYVGEVEAATKKEALEKGQDEAHVSFCHQCSSGCEDPEVEVTDAEEVES